MATAPIETTAAPAEAAPANDATVAASAAAPAPITAADMYPDDVREDETQTGEGGDQNDAGEGEGEADPLNPDINDQLPAIEPPASWNAEDKEQFKALLTLGEEGAKIAETLTRREKERDAFVANKGREYAQQRQGVEREARTAIQQTHEIFAAEVEAYAQMILPQPPDQRLLFTGNPQDGMLYAQQKALYDDAASQHHQMQQQVANARAQASQIAEQQDLLDRQALSAEMADKLGTEWTDPSERQKLQETLYPIGKELGYSDEAMADANASDLLALKRAHTWKAKAEKYDALQRAKMEPVRAAKQLPRVTQPGTGGGGGGQAPRSAADILYPNDVRR